MGLSFSHILLVLVVVLILFGAGKLPQVMGDLAKGVKAFKDGMNDSNDDQPVKKSSKKIIDGEVVKTNSKNKTKQ